jgi:hypothetical protein
LAVLPWLALASALGLLIWSLWPQHSKALDATATLAHRLLWLCFALPVAVAFLVNQRYPFFPAGGERLLLFVLPYCLLLLTSALTDLRAQPQRYWQGAGAVAFLVLVITASVGVWVFYTLPRYQADD